MFKINYCTLILWQNQVLCSYLFFIPPFTSTFLSPLKTTRIYTSPDSASFFRKKLLTLVSINVPNRVTCNRFAVNLFSIRLVWRIWWHFSHTNLSINVNKYNNLDLSQNYTGFLIRFTYPCLQILSLCNTHIWCNLRAQSLHVTNGSLSSISFFFSINSDLLIGLKEY